MHNNAWQARTCTITRDAFTLSGWELFDHLFGTMDAWVQEGVCCKRLCVFHVTLRVVWVGHTPHRASLHGAHELNQFNCRISALGKKIDSLS